MKLKKRLKEKGKSDTQAKLLLKQGKTDITKAIANLDDDIAMLDIEIEDKKSSLPLNSVGILTLINSKALKERALKQTKQLYDELF